jgi:AhpD family alkylhydroperoxidase
MNRFKKRYYRSPKDFLADLWFPLRNRKKLGKAMSDGPVSPAFRERIMLAVTGVNGCRYCSYFHARQAVKSDMPPAEISRLLEGDVSDCPAGEAVAIAYALHWAETGGKPEPDVEKKLLETYEPAMVDDVHVILRMIRLGNLTGNTLDYLIYRLTFGKCRAD